MAFVMTTAGSLGCAHGGSASLSSSAALKVDDNSVLLASDISGLSITGCGQTGSNQKQCSKFVSFTGSSTQLSVGGTAVVLDSFVGVTDGVPSTQSAPASAGQQKLSAV